MARTKIDIINWKRRREFEFFIKMLDPTFSVTTEVEVGRCYDMAKARKESFFIHYIHCVFRALNEIEELRYRVERDEDGTIGVYHYDRVDISTPIKVDSEGRYIEVYIPYSESFEEFYDAAQRAIASAPAMVDRGNVFVTECKEVRDYTLAGISTMSELYFTSTKPCLSTVGAVDQLMLLSVGRMVERNGVRVMPLSITIHHGVADGGHIGKFVTRLQKFLNVGV